METIQHKGSSDRITRKWQRIAGLKALLEEWELSDNRDLDYIRGLKARLLSVQNQLKDIRPEFGNQLVHWKPIP
jgi:hypothetical protein